MSRPARAGSAGKPVTIRATDAERERWERCAKLSGVELSALIRSAVELQCNVIERDLGPSRKRRR